MTSTTPPLTTVISGVTPGLESVSAGQDTQVLTVTDPVHSTPGAGGVTTSAPVKTLPPALLSTAPAPVLLAGEVPGVTLPVSRVGMVSSADTSASVPMEECVTMCLGSVSVSQVRILFVLWWRVLDVETNLRFSHWFIVLLID